MAPIDDFSSSDDEEQGRPHRTVSTPWAQHLRATTMPRDDSSRASKAAKSQCTCGSLVCNSTNGKWVKLRLALLVLFVLCIVAAVVIGTCFWPKGFKYTIQNVQMGTGNTTGYGALTSVAVHDRTSAAQALAQSLQQVDLEITFHNPSILAQYIKKMDIYFVAVPQHVTLTTSELPRLTSQKPGHGSGLSLSLKPNPSSVQLFLQKYLDPMEAGYYLDDSTDFQLRMFEKSAGSLGSLHFSHAKVHICTISLRVINNFLQPTRGSQSC